MSDTVFGKIIRGELPCHRVYENEDVLAFLDIAPMSTGHTLLIPKRPARTLDELPEDVALALGKALPVVARAVKRATGASDYNVLQSNGATAGQTVFHVHFHVIPKPSPGAGLRFGAGDAPGLSQEEMGELAQRIAAEVGAGS